MQYKRVEKIDWDFSVLGYGCWGASGKGSWSGHTDKDQTAAIQRAIELGVNFFDVAPIYGCGHAETTLGKAIKGRRDKLFIATKVGLPWTKDYHGYNDVTAKNIKKEIDDSLTRLGVDYVDLYQVHWPTDKDVPLEETMDAMKQIQDSGKVKYIGLSNYSVSDLKQAQSIVNVVSMQGLYNMLEQNATHYHNIPLEYRVNDEVFPEVAKKGMAFFPYSPLLQGLLTGKVDADTVFEEGDVRQYNPVLQGDYRRKAIEKVCEIKQLEGLENRSLSDIAINYLVAKDQVTSVIATHANVAEVEMNVKALEWKMTPDTVQMIDKIVG